MAHSGDNLTSLIGHEIYATNGVFVGEIKDIALDLEAKHVKGLAVAEPNPALFDEPTDEARGVLIPYQGVQGAGDIIVISEDIMDSYTL